MAFKKVEQEEPKVPCVSLIGMAGAGKSTLAPLLAEALGWAHLDSDRHIEAYYAMPLQAIYDEYGHERFLQIEGQLVSELMLHRTVISTGGSVVYSQKAITRLRELGTVVHLDVSEETFLDRVGDGAERGLAIAPGLTMRALYREREPLYREAADITVRTDDCDPEECVRRILEQVDLS
ncbi:homoserine kinase [Salidesulfovibrio onnuriiensis]|uniref:homoserine kinase n=1 Tax=Salidesulfovibrio onnuriiensis TaxID=2583823 RepID=UPI0011CB7C71|nr:homoserine kinase [Salidesulfovibrio onnuriiensis]